MAGELLDVALTGVGVAITSGVVDSVSGVRATIGPINLAFTYFAEPLQQATLERICRRLSDGGALVLGRHEELPPTTLLEPWIPALGIHRHVPHRPGRR